MIEFILTAAVVGVIASGVFTDVVQPTTNYVIDQGKVGYEYVQEKLD